MESKISEANTHLIIFGWCEYFLGAYFLGSRMTSLTFILYLNHYGPALQYRFKNTNFTYLSVDRRIIDFLTLRISESGRIHLNLYSTLYSEIKMEQLREGAVAPPFVGKAQDGRIFSLEDFKGKKLILYFYPKDNTPGCTAEACDLSENYDFWLSKGFEVVGISPDNVSSHQKFSEKYGLRFNLIADTEKIILQDYGVWGEKMNYGKSYMGVIRTTFVINEKGIIEKIFKKVDTKKHTEQIVKEIKI